MIRIEHVDVRFPSKDTGKEIHAVKDVSLQIDEGDIFGIVGFSGAGKSTLVRTINLLQRPTSGHVFVRDKDITLLSEKDLREERKKIGMIFQHFNLMRSRTIYDNVAYPLRHSKLSKEEKDKKILSLLELVGISDKAKAYPSQLSGGQKQRVGIARALANDPDILLCDEATSALDPQTTTSILKLLKELNIDLNLTIVLITHEMRAVKEICNKVAVMENGNLVEQGDIIDIFMHPKQEITKNFIESTTQTDSVLAKITQNEGQMLRPGEQLAAIAYSGASTTQPIVSTLYERFSVTTNILSGSFEYLQDIPVGNLIVSFSGSRENLDRAYAFLEEKEIAVQFYDHQGHREEVI